MKEGVTPSDKNFVTKTMMSCGIFTAGRPGGRLCFVRLSSQIFCLEDLVWEAAAEIHKHQHASKEWFSAPEKPLTNFVQTSLNPENPYNNLPTPISPYKTVLGPHRETPYRSFKTAFSV